MFLQGEQNELLYQQLLVGKGQIRTETCLVDQCKGAAFHLDKKRLCQAFEGKETWCGLDREQGEKLKTEFRHTFQEMLL